MGASEPNSTVKAVVHHLQAELPRPDLITVDPDLVGGTTVDYRGWYRGNAIALARPKSVEDVQAVVRACVKLDINLVPQGGNSSMCGGSVPAASDRPSLVVSLAGLDKIRSVDKSGWSLVAEAGCTLAAIQDAAAGVDRRFGLDFGARGSARLGGFLATNAGGSAVLRYGTTRDLVLGVEAVLPDGRVWSGLRTLRKDNSGFDLKHLFIGSEGTIGIVTAAALRLHAADSLSASVLMALPSLESSTATAELAVEMCAGQVSSIELMPKMGIELACAHVTRTSAPIALDSDWYLLVRLEGRSPVEETLEQFAAEAMERELCVDAVMSNSSAQEEALWNIRDAFSEVHRELGQSYRFDFSVPLGKVPQLFNELCVAIGRVEPSFVPFGFGHMGDGNLHFSACQPKDRPTAEFQAKRHEIEHAANDVVWSLGGSVSAEHGIGQLHLQEMIGQKSEVELDLMRRIKTAFDPKGLLNPGVLLPSAHVAP